MLMAKVVVYLLILGMVVSLALAAYGPGDYGVSSGSGDGGNNPGGGGGRSGGGGSGGKAGVAECSLGYSLVNGGSLKIEAEEPARSIEKSGAVEGLTSE